MKELSQNSYLRERGRGETEPAEPASQTRASNAGGWGLRTSGRHSSNQVCCGRLSLRCTAREVSDDAWCAAHCGSCCAQACQVLSERIVFVAVHTHTATAADATAPVTPAPTHARSNAEHPAHFNSSRNCSNGSNGSKGTHINFTEDPPTNQLSNNYHGSTQ